MTTKTAKKPNALYADAAKRIKKGYTIKFDHRTGKPVLYIYSPEKYLDGAWPYSYLGRFESVQDAELIGKVQAEITFGLKPKGRKSAAYRETLQRLST